MKYSMVGLDVNNGIALRTYLEALRSWMQTERSTWDTHYKQLAAFFLPRQQRFNYYEADVGYREDFAIVDNTATFALKVLAAGIFSSESSPTQTWFHFRMEQDDLNEREEIKEWLDKAEAAVQQICLKSNFYETILNSYGMLALYGIDAFAILEDEQDTIRCVPYPTGSYYVSGDNKLRIDMVLRIINMTTREMVDEFGLENCSQQVQTLYNSNAGGQKEFWWQVVHVVMKNTYFDPSKPRLTEKPWLSIHYELSSYNPDKGILRKSGFDEMPVIVSRWTTVGENFYGESPAMDALGDVRELQLLHKRKSQAIDKMVNPPMVGDPALENQKMSVLPGQVTFASMRDGSPGFKPAYQIDFKLEECLKNIDDCRRRINDALYKSVFLANLNSDRREITAEEIRARKLEQMLILGPMAIRNGREKLDPAIKRIFKIAERRRKIPPMPASMRGQNVTIRFESILASAQRIQKTANIDRLLAMLGGQVAVNQGIMDNFNLDMLAMDYAEDLGIPANAKRSPDEIQKIRDDRAKQQQQTQNADNAQKLAAAGQNLANTDLRTPSALTTLLNGQGGSAA